MASSSQRSSPSLSGSAASASTSTSSILNKLNDQQNSVYNLILETVTISDDEEEEDDNQDSDVKGDFVSVSDITIADVAGVVSVDNGGVVVKCIDKQLIKSSAPSSLLIARPKEETTVDCVDARMDISNLTPGSCTVTAAITTTITTITSITSTTNDAIENVLLDEIPIVNQIPNPSSSSSSLQKSIKLSDKKMTTKHTESDKNNKLISSTELQAKKSAVIKPVERPVVANVAAAIATPTAASTTAAVESAVTVTDCTNDRINLECDDRVQSLDNTIFKNCLTIKLEKLDNDDEFENIDGDEGDDDDDDDDEEGDDEDDDNASGSLNNENIAMVKQEKEPDIIINNNNNNSNNLERDEIGTIYIDNKKYVFIDRLLVRFAHKRKFGDGNIGNSYDDKAVDNDNGNPNVVDLRENKSVKVVPEIPQIKIERNAEQELTPTASGSSSASASSSSSSNSMPKASTSTRSNLRQGIQLSQMNLNNYRVKNNTSTATTTTTTATTNRSDLDNLNNLINLENPPNVLMGGVLDNHAMNNNNNNNNNININRDYVDDVIVIDGNNDLATGAVSWDDRECDDGVDDDEEICTCNQYEMVPSASEDELPSRDVDLSGYRISDTISDDILKDTITTTTPITTDEIIEINCRTNHETPRSRRKRKLTETTKSYRNSLIEQSYSSGRPPPPTTTTTTTSTSGGGFPSSPTRSSSSFAETPLQSSPSSSSNYKIKKRLNILKSVEVHVNNLAHAISASPLSSLSGSSSSSSSSSTTTSSPVSPALVPSSPSSPLPTTHTGSESESVSPSPSPSPSPSTSSSSSSLLLLTSESFSSPKTNQLAICNSPSMMMICDKRSIIGGGCGATTPSSSSSSRSLILTGHHNPQQPELSEWLIQFQRWTPVERIIAINQFIECCEPSQVRHMMKVIEPQFQRDFISLLPKELALQVLSYLEPMDLLKAAQTCRSWRFLCDDNLLWKDKCKKNGIPTTDSSYEQPKRGRTGNMPMFVSEWKAAYMRQHIIELNWRSNPIREPKILKGHDDHVITCLQFCGNRIVSGSDDNTLKIWSAVTGKCLRTLIGHTGGVWSSQMAGNIIISGSTDRTLRVWNVDTGLCTQILTGHTSTVRCMHLHGNKVVSGSRDATLRVWDINSGDCLQILVGHLAAVRCVQYDGKIVVSGAYDYTVKVWNPERQECLHTLQGHTNRVYSLQFDGVHIVSGSLDTSIRVWDVESGSCKHTLMGHQSLTSGMELRQNILVSGNADSTVKVWNITNGQCLQTLSGSYKHQSAVTCLQFNTRFVITSSDDGTVKLWDVRTGVFIRNLVTLDSGGSGGVVWRIRSNDTKLVCAVGSRNGTEETKLVVLDFDVEGACLKCS